MSQRKEMRCCMRRPQWRRSVRSGHSGTVCGRIFLSESAPTGEKGQAELTGNDAHAWVEIYFDGIGWLPADVTPGYYYNVASLQKMVGSPDSVQKECGAGEQFTVGGADRRGKPKEQGRRSRSSGTAQCFAVSSRLLGVLLIPAGRCL